MNSRGVETLTIFKSVCGSPGALWLKTFRSAYIKRVMNKTIITTTALLFCLSLYLTAFAVSTQVRIDSDLSKGKPIVIQVSVALADNKNQWIVPVPEEIGNGQDPRTNLYWGALYGLKTYMTKKAGWKKLASVQVNDERILERLVLKKHFIRKGKSVLVYLVADAWDGKYIVDTIKQFIRYNAGYDVFSVNADGKKIYAGGKAHLIVYIGHNALMDYGGIKSILFSEQESAKDNPDNDSIVLACKSQPYFSSRLKEVKAHPLVLTTGLMAPEAYSLHSAIEQWIAGASDVQVRKAAAGSYSKYQKISVKAAERLFGGRQ